MHAVRLRIAIVTVATSLAVPAMADDALLARFRPAEPLPHERLSSWRTEVIPAPVEAPPASRHGAGRIITAGLQSHAAPAHAHPITGPAHLLDGIASYYWQEQKTSTGERFDRHGLTAAHRTLPFGTRVRVTHALSGRSVVVRINDRGPFKPGRVIDLSEAAAKSIDMTRTGLAFVRIEVLR